MAAFLTLKLPLASLFNDQLLNLGAPNNNLSKNSINPFLSCTNRPSLQPHCFSRQVIRATTTMESEHSGTSGGPMKLLFVEMGVGYDQHGQDITAAAMRACRDAISSNSIPAFRRGSIPGVTFGQMKLQIKLGVPHSLQQSLDIERVKSVFPYGEILNVDVVDGGLICSSGVCVEEMGDKNEDCYIVNAATAALVLVARVKFDMLQELVVASSLPIAFG